MDFSTTIRTKLILGLPNESGATRDVQVVGSATDIGLNIVLKGAGKLSVSGSIVTGSRVADGTGTNGEIYYNTTDNKFRAYENGAWVDLIGGGGGGGAPTNASYVVLGVDATLTQERVLTPINPIYLSDNGAGGDLDIGIAPNGITNAHLDIAPAMSVKSNWGNSPGSVDDLVAGTNHQVLMRSGDNLVFALINGVNITNNGVSFDKIAASSGLTIVGNPTNAPANYNCFK